MIITEKSYTDALDRVVNIIEARKPSLDVNNIVIVPDVYTFALEKRLFSRGKGAFDVEVTTFNRLYTRLNAGGERVALSKQGALMLLKKVCREHADELGCYSRSCLRTGFAVKLYDALNTLRACAVSPSDLEAAEDMRKSRDLAVLYREYLREIDGRYVDAAGRNRLLGEIIEKTDAFRDANVYVTLYDKLSAEVKRLLGIIERSARSLTIVEAAPPEGYSVSANTVVVKCRDRVSEYKEAAKRIASYVYDGGRYDDVAIVDASGEYHAAKRIFDEFEIPYYTGEKLPLAGTELARFVFGALECVRKKYRTADMLALSVNAYTGITARDADLFRCYVNRYCVDYIGFTREFGGFPDCEPDALEGAERARARLMDVLGSMDGCFSSATAMKTKLLAALEKCGAAAVTEAISAADEEGRNYGGVYEKAVGLIELYGEMNGGGAATPEEAADVLREIFEGTEVSLVPNRSDVVQIGALSQYRGQRIKYAIVVGFNDGEIPPVNRDDGLLTDADAAKLGAYSLKVEPCTAEKNALCRGELWHFLKAADRLFITYRDEGGMKPSFDLKLLLAKNGIAERSTEDYEIALASLTDAKSVARLTGSRSIAFETLMKNPGLAYSGSLGAASGELGTAARRQTRPTRLSPDRIPFLRGKVTSVSALQTYFECPYKYFFKYGLKIKKADDGVVTPLDVGTFLHKTVELFVSEGMPDDVESFVERTAEKEKETFIKYRLKENERMFLRLKTEAVLLCRIAAGQVSAGAFRPYATEASFGREDSALKGVTLPRSGVRLIGDIDRIDVFGDRARVIDYKTGAIEFSWSELYFGKKIQLMIYARVMKENGFRPAGFFYFPFSVRWSDDDYDHRLKGAFDCSPEMLKAMDGNIADKEKSKVIEAIVKTDKNGEAAVSGKNTHACTEDELIAAADYAVAVADEAATEILGGSIAASPVSSGRTRACDYCDYAAACGAEVTGRSASGAKKEDIIAAVTK